MELFTRKYVVTESNPDNDDVTEFELTVTNDLSTIEDGECVSVYYISPRSGKMVEEMFDYGDEPMDAEGIIEFVANLEGVDACYFDVEE